jgi:hypothetical protein
MRANSLGFAQPDVGMVRAPPAAVELPVVIPVERGALAMLPKVPAGVAKGVSTVRGAAGRCQMFSIMSTMSLLSFLAVLSSMSVFSILSIGSVGSATSVGSAFSVNSVGSLFSANSVLSIGCYNKYMEVCVDWFGSTAANITELSSGSGVA